MSINIEKLKAQDEAEWETAYRLLLEQGKIILAAETEAKNWPLKEEDWKDLVSQTIAELHDSIGKFGGWEKLQAYFSKAVKHRACDEMRKPLAKKRGKGKVLTTDQIDHASKSAFTDDEFYHLTAAMLRDDIAAYTPPTRSAVPAANTTNDQLLSNEIREQLTVILGQLKATDRELIEDAFLNQLSHQEIATKNSWTVKSIGGRIKRALEKLRAQMPAKIKKELKP